MSDDWFDNLQETWLLPHDIAFLGGIDAEIRFTGKSYIETKSEILRGRPYAGVAFSWKKSVFSDMTDSLQ